MQTFHEIIRTDHNKTTIIIRLMVGIVFVSEGLQKFLFPAERGEGRFEDIGLPWTEFLGPFVGFFETLCGLLLILGFVTRLGAVPLIIIMLVAIFTTKIDTFATKGIWEGMHASRTDWSMLLGSIFLLINGGGRWSADRGIQRKKYKSRGYSKYWN